MIPDEECPDPKPITMRFCQMVKTCPDWTVSQWSKVKTLRKVFNGELSPLSKRTTYIIR